MLEVIIDPEVGTILGHSVYTESDISPELVCCIINDVEMMDIDDDSDEDEDAVESALGGLYAYDLPLCKT